MITLAQLSEDVRDRIAKIRFDSIVEKHEGPMSWHNWLKDAEVLTIDGRSALLPVPKERHTNITILRSIVSQDERALTVFLKDVSYVSDPELEWYSAGYVAVCERLPDFPIYVATVYHEWFITDNAAVLRLPVPE